MQVIRDMVMLQPWLDVFLGRNLNHWYHFLNLLTRKDAYEKQVKKVKKEMKKQKRALRRARRRGKRNGAKIDKQLKQVARAKK